MIYEFDRFRLDSANRLLTREGEQLGLQARAFDCLLFLVSRAGQLVTKAEIMDTIWTGSFVEESNLTVAISTIRHVLGENQHERRFIQTISGRGYRFICSVHEVTTEPVSPEREHAGEVVAAAGQRVFASAPTVSSPESYNLGGQLPLPPSSAELESRSRGRGKLIWKVAASAALLTTIVAIGFLWWRHWYSRSFIASLAVLPFYSQRDGTQDDYLLLGLADTLITDVGKLLPIRPMSSVLRYSSRASDPAAAGREQGVDAVLTGRLTQNGNVSTIHVTMIRSADGQLLWQRDVSAKTGDMVQLQAALDNELRKTLLHMVNRKNFAVPTSISRPTNNDSYHLYLRGRYFWNRRTDQALRQSIDYYKQSIVTDHDFALAYAGLADSYALLGSFSVAPRISYGPDARATALSAISLDPNLAEPHASLGMLSFFADWNGLAAEKEFEQAIVLNTNYATAHHWYALDLAAMGRLPQARYEIRQAEALDPLSLIIDTNVGWILYLDRNYNEAIKEYGKVLELDPTFARARTRMGMAQMQKGDLIDAVQNLKAAVQLSGNDSYVIGLLGQAEAMNGQRAMASLTLRNLKIRSQSEYVPPVSFALIYIGLGEDSEALGELQQGFQDHSTALTYAKVDPAFDRLRQKPAFQQMLKTMRF